MSPPQLEVAEVFRRYEADFADKYGAMLSVAQRRAMQAIIRCRTRELGGHRWRCDDCGHERIAYNSCRNRHCPKCQAQARARWLDARAADLLSVPYFHVVFTLPEQLGPLALQNPRVAYSLLFRAAWETLRDVAANPKHLGAKIGALVVLHTWGQNLMHHPHLHCVVPGGGLSPDGSRWIACRGARRDSRQKDFFLPVRVLSRVFRGKFVAMLKQAYRQGQLQFHGRLASLVDPASFERLLNAAVAREWIVYCKLPFGGPEQVLKYLARYTHRVAIANSRLVDIDDGQVRFRWKNYARGNQRSTMSLPAEEFIRRFLLHVLPSGFVRIRHYGLLCNRRRTDDLERCRQLLGATVTPAEHVDIQDVLPTSVSTTPAGDEGHDESTAALTCPHCGKPTFRIVEEILPSGRTLRMMRLNRPRASPHHQIALRGPP
jgi:Zn finger protein HypA/HybF involved in hydrogenase expression